MERHTLQGTELHSQIDAEELHWSRTHGQNRLIALVQNPRTVFVYWELKAETKRLIAVHLGHEWSKLQAVLRLYDVTEIRFNGNNAHGHLDIFVPADADNWYVHHLAPGRDYLAVFGVYTDDGHLLGLLQSQSVHTPSVEGVLTSEGDRFRLDSVPPDSATWVHQFTGYSLDESV